MANSSLSDFVAAVQAGRVVAGSGGRDAAGLADGAAILSASDADAVTAEAYNQDVVDPDTPWEETHAAVVAALGKSGA